jgi:hypothetical protein
MNLSAAACNWFMIRVRAWPWKLIIRRRSQPLLTYEERNAITSKMGTCRVRRCKEGCSKNSPIVQGNLHFVPVGMIDGGTGVVYRFGGKN